MGSLIFFSSLMYCLLLLICESNLVLEVIKSFNCIRIGFKAGVAFKASASLQAYLHKRMLSILSFLPLAIPKLHLMWAALPICRGNPFWLQKDQINRW